MTTSEDYVFDDRTLHNLLTQFRAYSATIPFGYTGRYWDECFFNDNQSIDSLIALLKTPENRKGELLPHQAFLLAFFRMLETPRRLINTLPARHRELYFRGVLDAKPQPAQPDSVLLQFTPESALKTLLLPKGLLLDGGQDSQGTSRHYRLDNSLLINHAIWSDLRWIVQDENGKRETTVLDLAERIDFPEEGVRLFSDNGTTTDVIAGRLLVLPELAGMAGRGRQLEVAFSGPVTGEVRAEIAVKGAWVGVGAGTVNDDGHLRFALDDTLPLDAETMPNYPFRAPLVRLWRADGALPVVGGVSLLVDRAVDVQLRDTKGIIGNVDDGNRYPFGLTPELGTSIAFMSPSWCRAGVTFDITLQPTWIDRPRDFKAYYQYYDEVDTIDNGVFTLQGDELVDEQGEPVSARALFGAGATDNTLWLHRQGCDCEPTDKTTFWKQASTLSLAGKDFQHAAWRGMAQEEGLPKGINAPYTPELGPVSVRWKATLTTAPEQYSLLPFGGWQAETVEATQAAASESYELHMGFTHVSPGQQLSLYLALNTPHPFESDGITWDYLAKNNTWQPVETQFADNTQTFSRAGTVFITLPLDAINDGTVMPSGRYWLRANQFKQQDIEVFTPQDLPESESELQPVSERWPWLQGVWTNAAQATLSNAPDIADDHFTSPLPPGSVSRTLVPQDGLADLRQWLAGSGGKAAEQEEAMMSRVAHQVAHRGRASTWRDISTLITDNFPEVHHVRLPGVSILDGLYIPPDQNTVSNVEEERAWVQEVMLVPQVGINEGTDPERPIFSPAYLRNVRDFISERASPWLNIRVLNPYYRTVGVSYKVHWHPGVNEQHATYMLEGAVRRHFMPWLTGHNRVILGSTLTINDIMLVMQRQPEVNWIESVQWAGEKDACKKHAPIDTTLAVMMLTLSNESQLRETN
ncbi:hypothetical protein P8971_23640 [Serratia marcescens]|uniref:hypothetical protein n=1 Tax=Serratia marcescens TaxID=615 RepID=UPI003204A850